jgi:hypothetical protein
MERLGEGLRAELGRLGPQAGMAELVERWPEAVGEHIARFAWPARIARDGTLHVHAADAVWAFELGQRAADIAERLGVPAARFAPGPLPEPARVEEVSEPVAPAPADAAAAREIAAPIDDENLRKTVENAVAAALARGRHDRSE